MASVPTVKKQIFMPWWSKPLVRVLLFFQWIGMPIADRDTTIRYLCMHARVKTVLQDG